MLTVCKVLPKVLKTFVKQKNRQKFFWENFKKVLEFKYGILKNKKILHTNV